MAGTKEYTNAAEILAAADTALGIGAGGAKYTLFSEGIYVGYKYYETRYEDSVMKQGNADGKAGAFHSSDGWNYADEVDYSFGYGLSYTSFTQELQNIAVEEGVITATVNVTNTGSLPGKEVVELYVQSPYTEYDRQNGVEKSSVQLVTFGKTGLLEPGAEETLTLKMDTYNIASYDAKAAKTWILEEGTYYFAVGNGAHEALNNILSAKGKTTADGMTANGDAALTKTWDNPTFTTLSNPTFTENGFNTENGLFHNNTDAQITNRLGDADPNIILGDSTVTYLTRTDWNGSWSSGIQALTANKAMIDHITFAPLYEKGEAVGDMYHYGMEGSMSAIMAMGKSYDDPVWDELLDQMIPEEMIATVGKNFGAIDPILAISFPGTSDNDGVGSGPATNYSSEYDQGSTVFEGITKYSTIDPRMYPSESVQASTFNQKLSYRTGEMMSEDCYYAGLTSLWGPGLNLHRHPYAGRNFEYYSEDSM
ncbi:MAG: fibronectin type III-like domain-contianing protein, partial [Lachnospiraceae bacterium]|nr:fibronectin type III-like domain-contianing protein [Lachnospiraceae bacterium]